MAMTNSQRHHHVLKLHLYILTAMAAMLTACGHRAASADAQQDTLQTDTVTYLLGDSTHHIVMKADWPVADGDSLAVAVRSYIDHEREELQQFFRDNASEYAVFEGESQIRKIHETTGYVTYLNTSDFFQGGLHGSHLVIGTTFRKSDGSQIGYTSTFDEEALTFKITGQRLFKDTTAPAFCQLLKEGVRSYFSEGMDTICTDADLKDMTLGVEDIDRLPIPQFAPYFTPDGLLFIYQQYEIAPYAVGLPSFTIAYDKLCPFLTDEAAALLPKQQQ